MLKQNKGTHIESETRKDTPTQSNTWGTGCQGALSHGKEDF